MSDEALKPFCSTCRWPCTIVCLDDERDYYSDPELYNMPAMPSHPHGHDWTSYDVLHCCLCSPKSKCAKHDPVINDGGLTFCRRCKLQLFKVGDVAVPDVVA